MKQGQTMQATPYLIGYFDRQDRARRFAQPGFMVRELTSYYHARQRELAKEAIASAARLGTLRGIRKQIRKLMKQAEKAQGEHLREIGAKIEALAKQVRHLEVPEGGEELNGSIN